MFCGLDEEERTKFRKKKRKKKEEKKEKNLIAAKSGLAGMKKYFKTYNHMHGGHKSVNPLITKLTFSLTR